MNVMHFCEWGRPPQGGSQAWAAEQTRRLNAEIDQRVRERTDGIRAAWERERRLAETLQRALLMSAPSISLPGLQAEACWDLGFPEALVGGDFWDAFPLDGSHVALVLGDVCGKGLVAALRIPEVRFALRAFLSENDSPAQALPRLNDWLAQTQAEERPWGMALVSLVLVVLDTRTGEGLCCAAGAEPPLVLSREGTASAIPVRGMTLGVEAGHGYDERAFHMGISDTLIMFTDGITEARRGLDFLGYEGARQLAVQGIRAQGAGDTARRVSEAVLTGARRFAGGKLLDDACVVSVTLVPHPSHPS